MLIRGPNTGHGRGKPSTVPAWLRSLALNTWTEIGGNVITDVDPANDPLINQNYPSAAPWGGGYTAANIADQWSGGALDDTRGVMWVMGGGHSGYYGNEAYSIDFTADAPSWIRRGYPSGSIQKACASFTSNGADASLLPDGRPHQVHTYNLLTTTQNGDLFCGPTGFTWQGVAAPNGHLFRTATDDWDASISYPKIAGEAASCGVCYDPIRNIVWGMNDTHVVKWDVETGTLTDVFGIWSGVSGSYAKLIYDSNRQIVVIFLGVTPTDAFSGASVIYFDATNPVEYFIAPQSIAQFLLGPSSIGFDPTSDKYFMWNGSVMTTITPPASGYSINNWIHTSYSFSGTPSANSLNGTWGRFQVSEKYGCVFLLNGTDERLWSLRIH